MTTTNQRLRTEQPPPSHTVYFETYINNDDSGCRLSGNEHQLQLHNLNLNPTPTIEHQVFPPGSSTYIRRIQWYCYLR